MGVGKVFKNLFLLPSNFFKFFYSNEELVSFQLSIKENFIDVFIFRL